MGKNYQIPNKIIIWGIDNYNALGLFRELHEVGEIHFLLNGGPRFCATQSRYCKIVHKVKTLEEGLSYLLSHYNDEKNKPFLITTGDIEAEFVDSHYDELNKLFYLTGIPKSGVLTQVLDKNYMGMLAKECGFTIPQSKSCQWNTPIDDVIFPCVLKPDKNRRDHKKEFKTKICKDRGELQAVLSQVDKGSHFILQEYIDKECDVLIYGCRTLEGEIILPGVYIKNRWDRGGDGSHGIMDQTIPNFISCEAINEFLTKVNYHGIFSVEFAIKDNSAFFYEFNLRNDGTSHYFYQAGVNIPQLWILSCLNIDISQYPQKLDGVKEFIAAYDDYVNVENGLISKEQWKIECRNATVFRYFDKDDKVPYYYSLVISKLRPIRWKLLQMLGKRKAI